MDINKDFQWNKAVFCSASRNSHSGAESGKKETEDNDDYEEASYNYIAALVQQRAPSIANCDP